MSDSSRLFFTGNSLEQAVIAAASHFDIDPEEVAYERMERRTGLLRGRRRIVIRVDSSNPRREVATPEPNLPAVEAPRESREEPALPEAPAPESAANRDLPAKPSEGLTGPEIATSDDIAEDASAKLVDGEVEGDLGVERVDPHRRPELDDGDDTRGEHRDERSDRAGSRDRGGYRPAEETNLAELQRASGPAVEAVTRGVEMLTQLADLEISAEVYDGDDQLVVELAGEDQACLVRGEGRLLLAIQHLLPRMVHGLTGKVAPCRVDSRGFRDRRVANLERLAWRTADDVRSSGREEMLRPMNPADRRIVHLALKEDDDVVTVSEGHGFFKRVTIRPR